MKHVSQNFGWGVVCLFPAEDLPLVDFKVLTKRAKFWNHNQSSGFWEQTLCFWIGFVFSAWVQVHFGLSTAWLHQMELGMRPEAWNYREAVSLRTVSSGPQQSYRYRTRHCPNNLLPKVHCKKENNKDNVREKTHQQTEL